MSFRPCTRGYIDYTNVYGGPTVHLSNHPSNFTSQAELQCKNQTAVALSSPCPSLIHTLQIELWNEVPSQQTPILSTLLPKHCNTLTSNIFKHLLAAWKIVPPVPSTLNPTLPCLLPGTHGTLVAAQPAAQRLLLSRATTHYR